MCLKQRDTVYSLVSTCVLFLLFSGSVFGQILKISCLEPKVIDLPFQKSDSSEIHYVNHENHTYWYKLLPSKSVKVDYTVSAVLPGPRFEVKLYQYNGGIFCKQLVKENVEPVKSSSLGSIKLKKNIHYYLGVKSLSSNCGHELRINHKNFKLLLRATENGSECANLIDYGRPVVNNSIIKDKAIIAGVKLQGTVRNEITMGAINADITLVEQKEDYELHTVAFRLKGFNIDLEAGKKYKATFRSMGYFTKDTTIQINDNTTINLDLKPVEKGEKFVIDNIYFYPNTFACKPESQVALEALKDYLLENRKIKIEIQGHTNGNKDVKKVKNNPRTGEEWNFEGSARELSKLRADKLKEYLVSNGVAAKRIQTIGKGGDEMIIPDPADMKEASKNIRVEIRIL